MEQGGAMCRSRRRSSSEKLLLLTFALLAIVSPLFIDRRERIELEPEEEPINISFFLLLILLLFLIIVIAVSCCFDESFTRFDAYWIYRVGGSSGGILVILMVLALVLKCKASSGPRTFWLEANGFGAPVDIIQPDVHFISVLYSNV